MINHGSTGFSALNEDRHTDTLVDFKTALKEDYGTSDEPKVYVCAYK